MRICTHSMDVISVLLAAHCFCCAMCSVSVCLFVCVVCVCPLVVRLMIWAFVGVPSLRQIYSYMSDPTCKRIGHQTFLGLVILSTELIFIVKMSQGEFPNPMPEKVKIGLAVFFAGYILCLIFLMIRSQNKGQQKEDKQNKTIKNKQ